MTHEQSRMLSNLYRQYFDDIYSFVYRHIGDKELSEDITQQTFLAACRKPDDVCGHENPIGWLYITASFIVRRENDRAYHRLEQSLEALDSPIMTEIQASFDEILPDSLAISAKDREILLLKYRDGLRHREIAEKYGITELASIKRLSKALANCKNAYREKIF